MKFSAIVPLLLSTCTTASGTLSGQRRLQDPTYKPGDFSEGTTLEVAGEGKKLYLSNGLKGRAIGFGTGSVVSDADGSELGPYHQSADGGATFPSAAGGYYYVSNSEQGADYPIDFELTANRSAPELAANLTGGVYSFEFNSNHELIGYSNVLKLTSGNCAGGSTPWNTWISCEERRGWGQCWQVDPSGAIPAVPTSVAAPIGTAGYGNWEAFAFDASSSPPRGYTTNDDYADEEGVKPAYAGAVVRFTPDETAMACLEASDDAGKWCALNSGTHDFLALNPDDSTFKWVTDVAESTPELYGGSEGSHVEDGVLTFVSAKLKLIIRLNLEAMTYTSTPVPFPQEPDNIRIFGGVLYLCTDGDENPDDGVWGIDDTGAFRVFKEEGHNYPAGVAFSPDGLKMYVSMWGEATYQLERTDGLAFDAETAGIVYEDAAAPTSTTTPAAPAPAPATSSAYGRGGLLGITLTCLALAMG